MRAPVLQGAFSGYAGLEMMKKAKSVVYKYENAHTKTNKDGGKDFNRLVFGYERIKDLN